MCAIAQLKGFRSTEKNNNFYLEIGVISVGGTNVLVRARSDTFRCIEFNICH